jgi:Fur family ferric uptake transcriptional regulator
MTVYNVLADLERVALVMRADVGPGRTLWEAGDEWHHHFVCRACGAIHDVPCAHGAKPCLDAGFTGGEVEEAQIIFRGLCNACRDREDEPAT